MWSSRPSLWRIDLEFHNNNYTWETCNMKYIDSLPIVIHLITISRHIHTRGRRTWPKYQSPPAWERSHWREIKANFVIIGRRNFIRVSIPHEMLWKIRIHNFFHGVEKLIPPECHKWRSKDTRTIGQILLIRPATRLDSLLVRRGWFSLVVFWLCFIHINMNFSVLKWAICGSLHGC